MSHWGTRSTGLRALELVICHACRQWKLDSKVGGLVKLHVHVHIDLSFGL
jgi:hypothetical protein